MDKNVPLHNSDHPVNEVRAAIFESARDARGRAEIYIRRAADAIERARAAEGRDAQDGLIVRRRRRAPDMSSREMHTLSQSGIPAPP